MQEEKPFYKSVLSTMTGIVKGGAFGAAVGGAGLAAAGAALSGLTMAVTSVPEAGIATALTGAATIGGIGGAVLGGNLGALVGGVTGWVNSRPDNELAHQIEVAQAEARGASQAVGLMQNAMLQQQQEALAHHQHDLEGKVNNWVAKVGKQNHKPEQFVDMVQNQPKTGMVQEV